MPLYEYACESCGNEQTAIRSFKEKNEPEVCRQCGGNCVPIPSLTGGYKIRGNNSASVTPKGSGSFRKRG